MPYCEDFPCCGHEQGACPDEDGRFPCCMCDSLLPPNARSSICADCQSDPASLYEPGSPDYYEAMDDGRYEAMQEREYDRAYKWGSMLTPGDYIWMADNTRAEVLENEPEGRGVLVRHGGTDESEDSWYDYIDVYLDDDSDY